MFTEITKPRVISLAFWTINKSLVFISLRIQSCYL